MVQSNLNIPVTVFQFTNVGHGRLDERIKSPREVSGRGMDCYSYNLTNIVFLGLFRSATYLRKQSICYDSILHLDLVHFSMLFR